MGFNVEGQKGNNYAKLVQFWVKVDEDHAQTTLSMANLELNGGKNIQEPSPTY